MISLTVVRHGETEENKARIVQGQLPGHLTETGIMQAKEVGEFLKNETYDVCFSSDLKRCVDTSEQILPFHPRLPFHLDPRLREYNFGVFQGQPSDRLDYDKEAVNAGPDRKLEGGESFNDVANRLTAFLNTLKLDHDNASVLVVTHGGPIRVLRVLLDNVAYENRSDTEIKNCSVWRFKY